MTRHFRISLVLWSQIFLGIMVVGCFTIFNSNYPVIILNDPATSEPSVGQSESGGTIAGYAGYLYTGQLHNHAAEYGDDGTGTITTNLNYMKSTATVVMDFGGLVPHSHMVASEANMQSYWSTMNAFTSSSFVALPGQEWSTLSSSNHVNVFLADHYCGVASGDIPGFYTWLDTSGGYGTFNHPGSGSDMNNWAYNAAVDKPGTFNGKMVAIEGLQRGTGTTTWFSDYLQALSNGWHIGVVISDDNHDGTPGDKYTNEPRTGMWLTALTPAGLEQAIQELRFFASQQPDAYIDLQCGSYIMGDVFPGTAGMTLSAKLNSALTYTSVQIYIDGIAYTMTNAGGGVYTYTIDASAKHYFFVRALTSTSNYVLSSPMWSDPSASPVTGDTFPPAITSGPSVSSSATSATVSWVTNETANAYVQWGTITNTYTWNTSDNAHNGTSHAVTLTGLASSTQYFYRVQSTDSKNNGPTTSGECNFTTTAPDTTPPTVTSGPTSAPGSTFAIITWSTNEIANTIIEYGTSSGTYPNTLVDNTANGTSHKIIINGLLMITTYYYRVKAYDRENNGPTNSSEASFTTTPLCNIVITEIMVDPSQQNQTGEYVELYNIGNTAIDINGWKLQDFDYHTYPNHTINNGGPLLVQPYSYLVMGRTTNTSGTVGNGGISLDYIYSENISQSNFYLSNNYTYGDEVLLLNTLGYVMDYFKYRPDNYAFTPAGETQWFSTVPAKSLELQNYIADNGDDYYWAFATSSWAGCTSGDYGSPGADNPGALNIPTVNDGFAPSITAGPTSTPSTTSALITWTTNETANTQVVYGLSSNSYSQTVTINNANGTSHSVTLSSLTSSTQYYYRVKSWDKTNNGPVTSDESTFTTTAPTTITGVYITEINCEPTAGYNCEYIELYNAGSSAVDLSNWQLKQYNAAYTTTFASGTTIAATGFLVVCRTKVTFDSTYSPTYATYAGSMAMNGAEYFELYDASSILKDKAFSSTSGTSQYLCYERKDITNDGSLSASWTSLGSKVLGNPGSLGGTIVNEFPPVFYPLFLIMMVLIIKRRLY